MIKKNYGKILGTVIVLGLALMFLTGCANQASQPAQTVTKFSQPEVQTKEQQYINAIRSLGNKYVDSNSDQKLIELGGQACTVLDSGYTVTEMTNYFINSSNFTEVEQYEFIGIIIGGGVKYFCPEYLTEVEAYLSK